MGWYYFEFTEKDGSIYKVMHYCEDFEYAKGYAVFKTLLNAFVKVKVCKVEISNFSEILFETNEREGKNQ